MSFYKQHALNHRGHSWRPPPGPEQPVRRDEGSARGGRHPDGVRGEGEEANQGAGTGAGRLDRGQERDQLLPARKHAALVRDQHVPQAPYLEDVKKVGEYDVAFVGVPFESAARSARGRGSGRRGSGGFGAVPEV